MLLAVPNVSEGRDAVAIAEIADAFAAGGAELLDVHSDPDHNRSGLHAERRAGRAVATRSSRARARPSQRIDLTRHDGLHPHVGALDVAPVVHLDRARPAAPPAPRRSSPRT